MLPLHIRWSAPRIVYDLSDPAHRRSVYEQVLREGTAEDIRLLVNREHLLELWHELYLPEYIQAAWSELF